MVLRHFARNRLKKYVLQAILSYICSKVSWSQTPSAIQIRVNRSA
jgi:hypothetical protein